MRFFFFPFGLLTACVMIVILSCRNLLAWIYFIFTLRVIYCMLSNVWYISLQFQSCIYDAKRWRSGISFYNLATCYIRCLFNERFTFVLFVILRLNELTMYRFSGLWAWNFSRWRFCFEFWMRVFPDSKCTKFLLLSRTTKNK